MQFVEFKNIFYPLVAFTIHQVEAMLPGFGNGNLTRWVKKGYVIRLKREMYTFPEYLHLPAYAYYFSSYLYAPSYISLHTALHYYGMIPEAITDITAVTTLKTLTIQNAIGRYCYQSVKPELFFGYDIKMMPDNHSYLMATPEKALVDLLYLHPFYKTAEDMEQIRLDDWFMSDELNRERLDGYLKQIDSPSLTQRMNTLLKIYQ